MTAITKYLNPQNDIAFKRIFGQEKNKDILISMLNAVLKGHIHRNIKNISFLSPIQEPETAIKKQSVVDVLCEDADGCQYIIEMQVANTTGFEERAQYYASKAFINQAEKGSAYENLKKVIFLAFCNFPIFPKKNAYKSGHLVLDEETYENNLDKLKFIFVDLVSFDKQNKKDVANLTLEEKFYYFLKHAKGISNEELAKLVGKDKVIEKAFSELIGVNWTNEELLIYEDQEKTRRDNIAAMDFREKKGIKETAYKIAKKLLLSGQSPEFVSEMTGLSLEEIKKLRS